MMNVFKTVLLGAALSATLPNSASAATLVLDLEDVLSVDLAGDPDNVVGLYDIGAFSEVVGVSYDLEIFADSPSYLSEVEIYFTDSNFLFGVVFQPGFGDSFPGVASYADTVDLVPLGLNFAVGADGLLRVEFAEGYDDFEDDWDATLNGTLTFIYNPLAVPEPANWATMIAGFGLIGGAMRRRQAKVTFAV